MVIMSIPGFHQLLVVFTNTLSDIKFVSFDDIVIDNNVMK